MNEYTLEKREKNIKSEKNDKSSILLLERNSVGKSLHKETFYSIYRSVNPRQWFLLNANETKRIFRNS